MFRRRRPCKSSVALDCGYERGDWSPSRDTVARLSRGTSEMRTPWSTSKLSRAYVRIRARRTERAGGCGVLSQTAILATEGPGGQVTILGTNLRALQVGDLALASGRNALGGSRVARGRRASGGTRDQHHERDCAANEADATSHAVQFRRMRAGREPSFPRANRADAQAERQVVSASSRSLQTRRALTSKPSSSGSRRGARRRGARCRPRSLGRLRIRT